MTPAPRGMFDAVVARVAHPCREHVTLTLALPTAFPASVPGQFVQLRCRPSGDDVEPDHAFDWDAPEPIDGAEFAGASAFLRRPFNLAGRRDLAGRVEVDVMSRAVGPGTRWLATLAPGDAVDLIGPLGGAGFTPPPERGVALLVGGGVGIPPMLYLAQTLAGRGRAVAFVGALARDLLPLTITDDAPPPPPRDSFAPLYNAAEFARHGVPAVVSTDDGSYGYAGRVTEPLAAYFDAYLTDNADRARATIYSCGPEPMLKAVAAVAARRNIRCELAVERAMACGLGTCQSCCIRVAKPDPAAVPLPGSAWRWALACTEGPVFDAERLRW